jgi:hydrogenase maturation protease
LYKDLESKVNGFGAGMQSEKTLVIGLGNPILGDDGVGWVVAREVEARLKESEHSVEVDCLALGGLSLMERLIGYQRVILIDSLNTDQRPQGSVVTFTLEDLADLTHGHTSAAHDASLKTALDVGRKLNAILPADKDVHVVAIEAQHVYDFKEELSPVIAAAMTMAVQRVLELLKEIDRMDDAVHSPA